jgi:hypothetical protein
MDFVLFVTLGATEQELMQWGRQTGVGRGVTVLHCYNRQQKQ